MDKRKRIAAAGVLSGLYMFCKNCLPLPDFVMGLILGIALGLLLLSLLPDRWKEALRKWKRRG